MDINAAVQKHIAEFRPDVAQKIAELKKKYRIRKADLTVRPTGWACYFGEGEKYDFYVASSNLVLSVGTVSERTMGMQGDALSYAVGKTSPPLKEGSWVINHGLFLGKGFIHVTYVGTLQL